MQLKRQLHGSTQCLMTVHSSFSKCTCNQQECNSSSFSACRGHSHHSVMLSCVGHSVVRCLLHGDAEIIAIWQSLCLKLTLPLGCQLHLDRCGCTPTCLLPRQICI